MELVFEILFEVYVELMMYIVPEQTAQSEKFRTIAVAVAAIVLLCVLALFIWGCVLIVDYDSKLGLIPISVAIIVSVVQIVAGIILHNKK